MVLSRFDFEVVVVKYRPAFDEETVRIVVRPGGVPQPALCQQGSRCDAGWPDDPFGGVATEMKGITVRAQGDAVHGDLLADIAGDDTGVVAVLPKVVGDPQRRGVREIERTGEVGPDHFFIRVQGEEILVKVADMVAGFGGYVLLPVGGYRLKRLACRQDVYFFVGMGYGTIGYQYHKSGEEKTAYHCSQGYQPDVLKGSFDPVSRPLISWTVF